MNERNIPNLLVVAYIHFIFELLLCAQIAIHALFDQDRLYRGITKYYTGGEKAVDNGEKDLDYVESAIRHSEVL